MVPQGRRRHLIHAGLSWHQQREEEQLKLLLLTLPSSHQHCVQYLRKLNKVFVTIKYDGRHCRGHGDGVESREVLRMAADNIKLLLHQHGSGPCVVALTHMCLFSAWGVVQDKVPGHKDGFAPYSSWSLTTGQYAYLMVHLGMAVYFWDSLNWLPGDVDQPPGAGCHLQQVVLAALVTACPAVVPYLLGPLCKPRVCTAGTGHSGGVVGASQQSADERASQGVPHVSPAVVNDAVSDPEGADEHGSHSIWYLLVMSLGQLTGLPSRDLSGPQYPNRLLNIQQVAPQQETAGQGPMAAPVSEGHAAKQSRDDQSVACDGPPGRLGLMVSLLALVSYVLRVLQRAGTQQGGEPEESSSGAPSSSVAGLSSSAWGQVHSQPKGPPGDDETGKHNRPSPVWASHLSDLKGPWGPIVVPRVDILRHTLSVLEHLLEISSTQFAKEAEEEGILLPGDDASGRVPEALLGDEGTLRSHLKVALQQLTEAIDTYIRDRLLVGRPAVAPFAFDLMLRLRSKILPVSAQLLMVTDPGSPGRPDGGDSTDESAIAATAAERACGEVQLDDVMHAGMAPSTQSACTRQFEPAVDDITAPDPDPPSVPHDSSHPLAMDTRSREVTLSPEAPAVTWRSGNRRPCLEQEEMAQSGAARTELLSSLLCEGNPVLALLREVPPAMQAALGTHQEDPVAASLKNKRAGRLPAWANWLIGKPLDPMNPFDGSGTHPLEPPASLGSQQILAQTGANNSIGNEEGTSDSSSAFPQSSWTEVDVANELTSLVTDHLSGLLTAWLTPGLWTWWQGGMSKDLEKVKDANPYSLPLVSWMLLDLLAHVLGIIPEDVGDYTVDAKRGVYLVSLVSMFLTSAGAVEQFPWQDLLRRKALKGGPSFTDRLQRLCFSSPAWQKSVQQALVGISNRLTTLDHHHDKVVLTRQDEERILAAMAKELLPYTILTPHQVLRRLLVDAAHHPGQLNLIKQLLVGMEPVTHYRSAGEAEQKLLIQVLREVVGKSVSLLGTPSSRSSLMALVVAMLDMRVLCWEEVVAQVCLPHLAGRTADVDRALLLEMVSRALEGGQEAQVKEASLSDTTLCALAPELLLGVVQAVKDTEDDLLEGKMDYALLESSEEVLVKLVKAVSNLFQHSRSSQVDKLGDHLLEVVKASRWEVRMQLLPLVEVVMETIVPRRATGRAPSLKNGDGQEHFVGHLLTPSSLAKLGLCLDVVTFGRPLARNAGMLSSSSDASSSDARVGDGEEPVLQHPDSSHCSSLASHELLLAPTGQIKNIRKEGTVEDLEQHQPYCDRHPGVRDVVEMDHPNPRRSGTSWWRAVRGRPTLGRPPDGTVNGPSSLGEVCVLLRDLLSFAVSSEGNAAALRMCFSMESEKQEGPSAVFSSTSLNLIGTLPVGLEAIEVADSGTAAQEDVQCTVQPTLLPLSLASLFVQSLEGIGWTQLRPALLLALGHLLVSGTDKEVRRALDSVVPQLLHLWVLCEAQGTPAAGETKQGTSDEAGPAGSSSDMGNKSKGLTPLLTACLVLEVVCRSICAFLISSQWCRTHTAAAQPAMDRCVRHLGQYLVMVADRLGHKDTGKWFLIRGFLDICALTGCLQKDYDCLSPQVVLLSLLERIGKVLVLPRQGDTAGPLDCTLETDVTLLWRATGHLSESLRDLVRVGLKRMVEGMCEARGLDVPGVVMMND